MKVSVLVITYNHERYIAQAINSILMQAVNFDYEIIIGEDASTDRTRQIVLELEKQHPDKIRVMLQTEADAERDRAAGLGGKSNFVKGLQACQGQYLALLEGDDYWTDSAKLQKQVDFLQQHPDFASCFHNVEIIHQDGTKQSGNSCPPDQKEVSNIEDLLAENFMQTGSVMYRRSLIGKLPEWFHTSSIGDWPLHIMVAQHGNIGYLDRVMGAYRIHEGAYWSAKPTAHKLLASIKLLNSLNEYLGYKYDRQIKTTQCRYYDALTNIYYSEGDMTKARDFLAKRIRLGLSSYHLPSKQQVGRLLRLQNPGLYNILKSLRNFISLRSLP